MPSIWYSLGWGRRKPMLKVRLAILATVAVGTIAGLALSPVAASGDDGSKRFTLFEHQTELGTNGANPNALSVGDTVGISSDLFTNSGMQTKVGHGGVACVVSSVARPTGPDLECSFSVVLAGGHISTTGLVNLGSATTPGGTFSLAVVGGTGRYRNARGELSVKVVSQADSLDTFNLS
jgi:hypothetical protein